MLSYGLVVLTNQGINLAARYIWFLMVSYGLPVPANHWKSIWLHDLLGFLGFPMASLCLQITGSQIVNTF